MKYCSQALFMDFTLATWEQTRRNISDASFLSASSITLAFLNRRTV